MRKNTARKWVHLLLDLLPVLIIPIFAIFLINHNPQGLQVQTGGYEITYQYQTNDVNSASDLIEGNVYKYQREITENFTIFEDTNVVDLIDYQLSYIITRNYIGVNYQSFTIDSLVDMDYFSVAIDDNNINFGSDSTNDDSIISGSCHYNSTQHYYLTFYFKIITINDISAYSNEDISSISASDYLGIEYTYNEGMIYDNTDIGSQLIYSMYIPVRDYFNMTNLFNFGDIYTWINNSMFSGNAPLPIFIVYNVIVYEFLIDLIFLIYSIFMFIIDFTSELLARCFSFSNKGGTR